AVLSHQRADAAIKEDRFKDEVVPIEVTHRFEGNDNRIEESRHTFAVDEGVRGDTNEEVLASLKPAFHHAGTVTAGNSSRMSDGAASVLLMDREKAEAEGLTPILKFRSFAVAGVEPEIMGAGPVEAVPKALKLAGLEVSDIGLFELNEAFASQSVQVIRTLGLDPEKVNV